jgi:hypothetical protein
VIRYLALVVAITPLAAQQPELPGRARSTASFVPSGYRVLKDIAGFLNGDEHRDVVLLIGDDREANDSIVADLRPRVLIVLAGTGDGFTLELANGAAVLGRHQGDEFDPLEELSLDRSTIVVKHHGGSVWRWASTHRFRFDRGDYRLIGRTNRTYQPARYCNSLKEYRPATFDDQDLVTRTRYRYRVPADRCVKIQQRGKLPRTSQALRDFNIQSEIDARDQR